jgi:hypothetical protein
MNAIYKAAAKEWAENPSRSVGIRTTDGAKLIRGLLKRKFPNVKFSVKSSMYAGGSSISIGWDDGPTQNLVDAYVKDFAGSGFDGMIDMKYSTSSWLYPDGSTSFKGTGGTEGSGGVRSSGNSGPSANGAIPVRFSANFVFTNRYYSKSAANRALQSYVGKNWGDDLQAAIEAGKVFVADTKYGWEFKNVDDFNCNAPSYFSGGNGALMEMLARRMLSTQIPVAA